MKLLIVPLNRGEPLACALTPAEAAADPAALGPEQLDRSIARGALLADQPYRLVLQGPFRETPADVEVRLDGAEIPGRQVSVGEGRVEIAFGPEARRAVFLDCYGLVRLEFSVRDPEGGAEAWVSEFLSVLLPDSPANQSLRRMAEVVYRYCEQYLPGGREQEGEGDTVSCGTVGNIDAQVRLIAEIAQVYSQVLPQLKTNAATRVENRYILQDADKLHTLTPRTVQYIAAHPGYLSRCREGTGLKAAGRSFMPRKALLLDMEQSRDTYENRVVFSFLYTVQKQTETLRGRARAYANAAGKSSEVAGYVSSADVIISSVHRKLAEAGRQLDGLYARITDLFRTYAAIWDLQPSQLDRVPEQSAVFRSVQPYRLVYACIRRWFSRGAYRFGNEAFMLPLMYNHQLYEYYVLVRLMKLLESEGFRFDPNRSLNFPYPLDPGVYRPVGHDNTFVFTGEGETVTLYFQPVVWGQRYDEENRNGISLRRSTSLAFGSARRVRNDAYFTPDYILRYESGNAERYLVLDAKYTTRTTFYESRLPELVYKYYFGIQATGRAKCVGVCALYGNACHEPAKLSGLQDLCEGERNFWASSLAENAFDDNQQLMELFPLIRALRGWPSS